MSTPNRVALAKRHGAFCIPILLAFVGVLSFPVLRDLHNLPTKPNVDAYQHLAFAHTFHDAVAQQGELPLWNPILAAEFHGPDTSTIPA